MRPSGGSSVSVSNDASPIIDGMADLRPVHARIERAHHHVADLERLLSNYSGRSFQRSMRGL